MRHLLAFAFVAAPLAATAIPGPIEELEAQIAHEHAVITRVALAPAPQIGTSGQVEACMMTLALADDVLPSVEDLIAKVCVAE